MEPLKYIATRSSVVTLLTILSIVNLKIIHIKQRLLESANLEIYRIKPIRKCYCQQC